MMALTTVLLMVPMMTEVQLMRKLPHLKLHSETQKTSKLRDRAKTRSSKAAVTQQHPSHQSKPPSMMKLPKSNSSPKSTRKRMFILLQQTWRPPTFKTACSLPPPTPWDSKPPQNSLLKFSQSLQIQVIFLSLQSIPIPSASYRLNFSTPKSIRVKSFNQRAMVIGFL